MCAMPGWAGAVEPSPYNWGLDASEPAMAAEFAQTKAICRRLGASRPPAADRPTALQAKALQDCDAAALYYGFGGRPDYAKARLCAFVEAEPSPPAPNMLTGPAILMQIYANGRGARRDLDLATAFACQIEGAPLESNARVKHLQAMRSRPGQIDFCDDITSGLAGGVCADRKAQMAAAPRTARLAALKRRLSPQAQRLYAPMQAAFEAYVEADGAVIEHGGGTAASEMATNEREAVRAAFVRDLARLLDGRWPASSPAAVRASDAQLNARYGEALAQAEDAASEGRSELADLRKAQRAWIAFRTAYLRFAAVARPSLSQDAVLAGLTRQRVAELRGLAPVG
jgi:uncharacterized protein YecT (DUF1311 family)